MRAGTENIQTVDGGQIQTTDNRQRKRGRERYREEVKEREWEGQKETESGRYRGEWGQRTMGIDTKDNEDRDQCSYIDDISQRQRQSTETKTEHRYRRQITKDTR